MRRSRTLLGFASALVLALTLGALPARAALITNVTVDVTPEAGGLFLYSYTVANLDASTDNVSQFDLSLTNLPFVGISTPVGAVISAITMPTGFINLYTSGDPSISFVSTDPATDIHPNSLGLFSFTSAVAPSSVAYQLTDLGSSAVVTSSISGPATVASVPEPSSIILSGLGVAGLAGWGFNRRRRSQAV